MPTDVAPIGHEHETKYVFARTRLTPLRRWLEHVCRPDGEHPFGIVSSIYYDTRDWDSLGEKINSDYLKTKVRLRWYEGEDSAEDPVFVEVKYRVGSRRVKARIRTSFTGQAIADLPLQDPALLEVPKLLRARGVALEKPIFPAFTIRYTRRRYLEGTTGARVCLDYAISASRASPLMLPAAHPVELETGVLEVKGAGRELPAVLHRLVDLGCRQSSFSKYSACYERLRWRIR